MISYAQKQHTQESMILYTPRNDLIRPEGPTFHTEKYDLGHEPRLQSWKHKSLGDVFFLSFFHFITYLRSDDQFYMNSA